MKADCNICSNKDVLCDDCIEKEFFGIKEIGQTLVKTIEENAQLKKELEDLKDYNSKLCMNLATTMYNVIQYENQIDKLKLELEVLKEKQKPLKLVYKNGFANCKCGCEFEREGYQGEEYCTDCGQKVWVGGYNGEESV